MSDHETTTIDVAAVRRALEAHGQEHLLRFHDELTPDQQRSLLEQIERLDLDELAGLLGAHAASAETAGLPDDLEPAPYHSRAEAASDDEIGQTHRKRGLDLIRRGVLGLFTVAGGQGTRLGWNGPKGTYPATVVTGKPLFRCFAEQVIAAQRKYGITIPWYIMTSPQNDAATRAFFTDNNCFGLLRQNITIFPQGTMPSVDAETGRVLLADRDSIALNPDGHGGAILALRESGALDDMRSRGVEHISYFQVDNPMTRIVDPVFLGLHAGATDSSGEMSSKMVARRSADEPVGVFARSGGRTMVVEYSDLPPDLAAATEPDGSLRFIAGSIAVHLISVAFAEQLAGSGTDAALPFHRARKKVPHVDVETGSSVEPEEPNAVKFEKFIFDALTLASSSLVLETDRTDEFAPIKNGRGNDSPATSHQLQSDRAGRWLEAHGVEVPRDAAGHVDAQIEISPLTALEMEDLVAIDLPRLVGRGEELVL
ncbi:MAG: UDPGP type 1 family protein [Planctomycetes bacterium]|nr:UDPGP type 1 family protein [Planctomycetota bacterium]